MFHPPTQYQVYFRSTWLQPPNLYVPQQLGANLQYFERKFHLSDHKILVPLRPFYNAFFYYLYLLRSCYWFIFYRTGFFLYLYIILHVSHIYVLTIPYPSLRSIVFVAYSTPMVGPGFFGKIPFVYLLVLNYFFFKPDDKTCFSYFGITN